MAPNKIAEPQSLSRWWAIPPVLVGFLVAIIVGHWQPVAIAKATGNSVGAVLFMPVLFWERSRERWFIPFLVSIAVAHAITIFLVPWRLAPEPQPGQKDIFILFAIVDVAICALLALVAIKLNAALHRSAKIGPPWRCGC
jgi:hypothetical protein